MTTPPESKTSPMDEYCSVDPIGHALSVMAYNPPDQWTYRNKAIGLHLNANVMCGVFTCRSKKLYKSADEHTILSIGKHNLLPREIKNVAGKLCLAHGARALFAKSTKEAVDWTSSMLKRYTVDSLVWFDTNDKDLGVIAMVDIEDMNTLLSLHPDMQSLLSEDDEQSEEIEEGGIVFTKNVAGALDTSCAASGPVQDALTPSGAKETSCAASGPVQDASAPSGAKTTLEDFYKKLTESHAALFPVVGSYIKSRPLPYVPKELDETGSLESLMAGSTNVYHPIRKDVGYDKFGRTLNQHPSELDENGESDYFMSDFENRRGKKKQSTLMNKSQSKASTGVEGGRGTRKGGGNAHTSQSLLMCKPVDMRDDKVWEHPNNDTNEGVEEIRNEGVHGAYVQEKKRILSMKETLSILLTTKEEVEEGEIEELFAAFLEEYHSTISKSAQDFVNLSLKMTMGSGEVGMTGVFQTVSEKIPSRGTSRKGGGPKKKRPIFVHPALDKDWYETAAGYDVGPTYEGTTSEQRAQFYFDVFIGFKKAEGTGDKGESWKREDDQMSFALRRNEKGQTAVMLAAQHNAGYEVINLLNIIAPGSFEQQCNNGNGCLHYTAASNGDETWDIADNVKVIRLILGSNPRSNLQLCEGGWSAFHHACAGRVELIEPLLFDGDNYREYVPDVCCLQTWTVPDEHVNSLTNELIHRYLPTLVFEDSFKDWSFCTGIQLLIRNNNASYRDFKMVLGGFTACVLLRNLRGDTPIQSALHMKCSDAVIKLIISVMMANKHIAFLQNDFDHKNIFSLAIKLNVSFETLKIIFNSLNKAHKMIHMDRKEDGVPIFSKHYVDANIRYQFNVLPFCNEMFVEWATGPDKFKAPSNKEWETTCRENGFVHNMKTTANKNGNRKQVKVLTEEEVQMMVIEVKIHTTENGLARSFIDKTKKNFAVGSFSKYKEQLKFLDWLEDKYPEDVEEKGKHRMSLLGVITFFKGNLKILKWGLNKYKNKILDTDDHGYSILHMVVACPTSYDDCIAKRTEHPIYMENLDPLEYTNRCNKSTSIHVSHAEDLCEKVTTVARAVKLIQFVNELKIPLDSIEDLCLHPQKVLDNLKEKYRDTPIDNQLIDKFLDTRLFENYYWTHPLLQDKDGNTALHLASLYPYLDVFKVVLRWSMGATSLFNNKGNSPLHFCCVAKDFDADYKVLCVQGLHSGDVKFHRDYYKANDPTTLGKVMMLIALNNKNSGRSVTRVKVLPEGAVLCKYDKLNEFFINLLKNQVSASVAKMAKFWDEEISEDRAHQIYDSCNKLKDMNSTQIRPIDNLYFNSDRLSGQGRLDFLQMFEDGDVPLDAFFLVEGRYFQLVRSAIHSTNEDGELPLHIAAGTGCMVDTVSILLSEYPESTNIANAKGERAIHKAANPLLFYTGDMATVFTLLLEHERLEEKDGKLAGENKDQSPLLWMITPTTRQIREYFPDCIANPQLRYGHQWIPLLKPDGVVREELIDPTLTALLRMRSTNNGEINLSRMDQSLLCLKLSTPLYIVKVSPTRHLIPRSAKPDDSTWIHNGFSHADFGRMFQILGYAAPPSISFVNASGLSIIEHLLVLAKSADRTTKECLMTGMWMLVQAMEVDEGNVRVYKRVLKRLGECAKQDGKPMPNEISPPGHNLKLHNAFAMRKVLEDKINKYHEEQIELEKLKVGLDNTLFSTEDAGKDAWTDKATEKETTVETAKHRQNVENNRQRKQYAKKNKQLAEKEAREANEKAERDALAKEKKQKKENQKKALKQTTKHFKNVKVPTEATTSIAEGITTEAEVAAAKEFCAVELVESSLTDKERGVFNEIKNMLSEVDEELVGVFMVIEDTDGLDSDETIVYGDELDEDGLGEDALGLLTGGGLGEDGLNEKGWEFYDPGLYDGSKKDEPMQSGPGEGAKAGQESQNLWRVECKQLHDQCELLKAKDTSQNQIIDDLKRSLLEMTKKTNDGDGIIVILRKRLDDTKESLGKEIDILKTRLDDTKESLGNEIEAQKSTVNVLKKKAKSLRKTLEALGNRTCMMECVVCFDLAELVALTPCGHRIVCETCVKTMTICPICRGEVKTHMKVYDVVAGAQQ